VAGALSSSSDTMSPATRGVPAHAAHLARWCLYAIAGLVPLVTASLIGAAPLTHDVSELPKVVVVRVLALLAVGAWAVAASASGRLRWHPAVAVLVAWLAWVAFVALRSDAPLVSLLGAHGRLGGVATLAVYPLLALAGLQLLATDAGLRGFARAVSVGAVPVALHALAQAFGADPFTYLISPAFEIGAGRAFATMGNPVFLGGYLVLVGPLAVVTALADEDVRFRAVGIAATVMVPGALVATSTRSAWLAALVQLVIALAIVRPWRLQVPLRGWLAAAGGAFAALLVAVASAAGPGAVVDRVGTALAAAGSGGERLLIWRSLLAAVAEKPVVGWGPDRVGIAFEAHRLAEHAERFAAFSADNAHMWPLELAVTTGIVGAVLALAVWVWALAGSTRPVWARGSESSPWVAAVWIALAGYAVHLGFSVAVVASQAIAWVLVGALLARDKRTRAVTVHATALRLGGGALALVALAAVVWGFVLLRADSAYLEYRARFNGIRTGDVVAPAREAAALSPADLTYASGVGLAYLTRSESLQDSDREGAKRDAQAAEDAFAAALKIEPADWFAWLELARAREALGDEAGAKAALKRAAEAAPESPLVRFRAEQSQ